jgi:hypothetical protein
MRMSERQWRVLSLLERLNRGEVTVGEVAAMILWDGSEHDWLEGRGPRLCLMGAIDDATGEFLPGTAVCDATTSIGRSRKSLRAGRSQHR